MEISDRIVLCMGEPGLISRILAKKLGSLVTFASLDEQAATAPGQLTITALKGLYRYDTIDADTELFGVIGDPVGHSLSPAIHNACFADLNMNKLYLPLHVQGGQEQFNQFLDNILARPWLGFRGFSVTIPHKHSLLEYVREKGGYVEPLAEKIGAANTLLVLSPWRGRPALASRGHLASLQVRHARRVRVQGQDALATTAGHIDLPPTTRITPALSMPSRPAWASNAKTCGMCPSRWSAPAASRGPSSRA